MTEFPRTEVAGISLPRMLIGSNWLLGYSHTGAAADKMIKSRHSDPEATAQVLDAYMQYGIDALMAPAFEEGSSLRTAVEAVQEKHNKPMIQIATPIINVDDNAAARKEAETVIAKAAKNGATFCLVHHTSAEQLVNKNKRTMDRLPDYLDMIRQYGMKPGLSAHMPELIQFPDEQDYDVETYVQIYNCLGFMMQVEIESVNRIIWNAKHPVMTIKSMAAGRCTPFVGLSFSYATIRPCDMVTVGAFMPDEVHEDVEIALAAIERRHPNLSARNSPAVTSIIKG